MRGAPFVGLAGLALAACAQAPVAPAPGMSGMPAVPSVPVTTVARPSAAIADAPSGSDRIPAGTFVFYEDFEHGYDKWEVPTPAAGAPGLQTLNAFSCGGLWSIHLGLPEQATYTPKAGTYDVTLKAPLDLRQARRPFLKYDVKGAIAPVSAMDFTAELRGADGAWKPVGRRIDGSFPLIISVGTDLTAYAGQEVGLRFRFAMKDGSAATRGFYLDDIQVLEPR